MAARIKSYMWEGNGRKIIALKHSIYCGMWHVQNNVFLVIMMCTLRTYYFILLKSFQDELTLYLVLFFSWFCWNCFLFVLHFRFQVPHQMRLCSLLALKYKQPKTTTSTSFVSFDSNSQPHLSNSWKCLESKSSLWILSVCLLYFLCISSLFHYIFFFFWLGAISSIYGIFHAME